LEKGTKVLIKEYRTPKITRLIKKKSRSARFALEAISYYPGRLCNNQPLMYLMGLKVISHPQQFSIIHFSHNTKITGISEYYLLRHKCFISVRVLETAHSIFNITDLHINMFACTLGSVKKLKKM